MADADLEQIRAARLEQLKAQNGGSNSQSNDSSSQPDSSASAARASMLSQILEPASADRLNRIRLVKASRATEVEDRLIMLAQRNMLRSKVTEEQLKDLLAQLSEKEEATGGSSGVGKIVVSRRKGGWDDDDDLEGLMDDK